MGLAPHKEPPEWKKPNRSRSDFQQKETFGISYYLRKLLSIIFFFFALTVQCKVSIIALC